MIADYWAAAQILFADIDRSDHIPMRRKTALTFEHATVRLLACSTSGAGLRSVGLLLENYLTPKPLPLVGELPPALSECPLMELLIDFLPIIEILPNVPHVAYHKRMHASCVERGYSMSG